MLDASFASLNLSATDLPTPRPAISSRASSYKSSSGRIAPLRRSSVVAVIPETDASLDPALKGDVFAVAVLRILIRLRLTEWKLSEADNVEIKTIASALTNSVYLVVLGRTKFLLRIYGRNVPHLIDREYETFVLARLAHHKIGPRMLGQFKNGRIEQWLESEELVSEHIRDPEQSRFIARRLREFHDYVTLLPVEIGKVSASVNLDNWIPALPKHYLTPSIKTFLSHVQLYRSHVQGKEGEVVFCHNDIQYGNILRVVGDEHHCLAVIDFEYAGPNPRAFDIANHFCEWMANYHQNPSHHLNQDFYPTLEQSNNFLREYIRYGKLINRREDPIVHDEEVDALRRQVNLWRGMSHAQWSIWGIIQSLPLPPPPPSRPSTAAAKTTTTTTSGGGEAESGALTTDRQTRPSLFTNSSKGRSSGGGHRRGSKTAQSPLIHVMRSPFLSANASAGVGGSSPGMNPLTIPESDELSLGHAALSHHATDGNGNADDDDGWMDVVPASSSSSALFSTFVPHDAEKDEGEGAAGEGGEEEEEGELEEGEKFDYLGYSSTRISLFYGELVSLGLVHPDDVPTDLGVRLLPPECHQQA